MQISQAKVEAQHAARTQHKLNTHTARAVHADNKSHRKGEMNIKQQKENCISNSILVFPGITRIAVATQTWKRKFYEQYQRGKPVRLSTEKIKFLSWTIWPLRNSRYLSLGGGGGSFLIRREKQSRWRSVARAADWLNRYFLHYKITNCPNNRTISQDICTLFTRYLYSTLCSWIVKQQTEWFTLCVASLIEVWNQEIFGNCSEKLVITLTAKRSDRPRIFELSTRSAFKDLYKIIFLEIIQIMKSFERL